MNLLKICSLIIFYFLSRVAFAANADAIPAIEQNKTLCQNDSIKD